MNLKNMFCVWKMYSVSNSDRKGDCTSSDKNTHLLKQNTEYEAMHPPGRNVKIIFYDFCNEVHLLVSGNVTTLI